MKFIVALFAFLALALPALADVTIEDVQLRRRGLDLNARIKILNAGSTSQQGIRLILYVRPNSRSIWEIAKIWSNIGILRAGNQSTREFSDAGNPHLQEIARNPAFEARVTVDYPGGRHQEKLVIYH